MGTELIIIIPVEWRIRMNLPEEGYENIIKWDKSMNLDHHVNFRYLSKPVGAEMQSELQLLLLPGEERILYPGNDNYLMTDDILEKYIIQHIEASTEKLINFSWHGGEPLLAGIDFYRKVV